MRLFRYTYRRDDGAVQSGTIEAVSIQAARGSLTELGIAPMDLREVEEQIVLVGDGQEPAPAPAEPEEKIVDWSTQADTAAVPGKSIHGAQYHPFTETLRLYAGWLAAWYFLIFAFGSYQLVRNQSLGIPFLEELFLSKTVLTLAFTAFLFLTLTSLHRRLRGGVLLGVVLILTGVAALFFFWGSV